MRRRLVINWCPAHDSLKRALADEIDDPALIAPAGKGWSYLTFCPIGTRPSAVLFDVGRIGALAKENNFTLPHEVIVEHNKVVVTAHSDDGRQSTQLFHLYQLVDAYCRRYEDSRKHPHLNFYGKLGGVYERPEKGRVWAVYTRGDDALLQIYETIEKLAAASATDGARFQVSLSNGLSALPRMLHGFDDPEYRRSGAGLYRITDPAKFQVLLEQALADHARYRFE